MTTPITDLNRLLTAQAEKLLKREVAEIKNKTLLAINALGSNFGTGKVTLYNDGKAISCDAYHVINSYFDALEGNMHDAFVNRHVNNFIASVDETRMQLDQLYQQLP